MTVEAQPTLTRRRLLQAGLVGAGAVAAGPVLWSRPGFAQAPEAGGVHLGFGADPTSQVRVTWSTPSSVTGAALDIGLDTSYGRVIAVDSAGLTGTPSVYHRTLVGGLTPDTRYRYRIRHSGGDPILGTFTTAPAGPAPFRFAAFGDMGVNADAAAIVTQAAEANVDLALVVGDLCYANRVGGLNDGIPTDPAVWDTWLAQVEQSAAAVPWLCTVGNHEMEPEYGELGYDGFLTRVPLPGGGLAGAPTTWAVKYGSVGFVALDANDASYEITRNAGFVGAAQDAWLTATLARLRADTAIDFIVVGFHHCAYCTNAVHGSDGGVRDRWGEIFDAHAVDLVVNGHNHSYERTHALRGGAVVAEAAKGATVDSSTGTTYITAGGGGQAVYPASTHPVSYVTIDGGARVPELAPWSSVRVQDHSLIVADVVPPGSDGTTTMKVRALDTTGAVVDEVTLRRSGARLKPPTNAPGSGAGRPTTPGAPLPSTGDLSGVAAGAALLAAAGVAAHRAGRLAD